MISKKYTAKALLKQINIWKYVFNITYPSQYSTGLNLNLDTSKYLDWNETRSYLPQKAKKCKDRPTQIYRILNKVQKTLNSIKEIEIPHF